MTLTEIKTELQKRIEQAQQDWQEHNAKELWPEDDNGFGHNAVGREEAYSHALNMLNQLDS